MQKAVIIGGTSGIGKALAIKLAGNGYYVGVTGRKGKMLETLVQSNQKHFSSAVMDASHESSISVLEKLIEDMGGVDIIVFCSGCGYINEKLDFEKENKTIELNVEGFTRIMNYVYSYFEHTKAGHIVAITTVMGLRGSSSAPAYSASKSFQINYLESLYQKAFRSGGKIIITEIRPGSVDTDMMKGDGHFWISSSEKAAEFIYNAIVKEKRLQYVSPRWKIIGYLLKWIPPAILKRI